MIKVTPSAIRKLKALIVEHPEDPIVRLRLKDLDEERLGFSITLEDSTQPDDEVQHIDGLTLAVEGHSAHRMDGITLDYLEAGGFTFLHPEPQDEIKLDFFNLN
ncbi:MAG: HesB/IscA family protein [Nitrospiraceae bacterium]